MMKRVKLLIITLVGFLIASGVTLLYRATAFSLCGLIGFNSLTCNGYFLELGKANALNTPETLNSNIVAQYNSPNYCYSKIITNSRINTGGDGMPYNVWEDYTRGTEPGTSACGRQYWVQAGNNIRHPNYGIKFVYLVDGRGVCVHPYLFSENPNDTLQTVRSAPECSATIVSNPNPRQNSISTQQPQRQNPNQVRETKCRQDVEFASSGSGVYIKSAIRQIPQNGKCNEKSPTLLASFNSNMSTVELSIDNQYLMTIVGVNTPQWQIRTASNNEGKENDIAQSLSSSLAINSSLSFSEKTKQLISRTTDVNLCSGIKSSCDFWRRVDVYTGGKFNSIAAPIAAAIAIRPVVALTTSTPAGLIATAVLLALKAAYSLRCNLYFPNSGYENDAMKQILLDIGETRREIYRRNQEKVRCDRPPNQRPPNQPEPNKLPRQEECFVDGGGRIWGPNCSRSGEIIKK